MSPTEGADLFGRVTCLTLAAALAGGGVLPAPGTASAAAASCVVGKWTMVNHTFRVKGKNYDFRGEGGKGLRLAVTRKSIFYDFGSASRLMSKGKSEGNEIKMWSDYAGRLRMPVTFPNARRGLIKSDVRKAVGNASVRTGGTGIAVKSYPLAANYHQGKPEAIAVGAGAFTCSGRTLRVVLSTTTATETSHFDWLFRRS